MVMAPRLPGQPISSCKLTNNNNKDKILASIEFNVSVEVPKWNKTPRGNYLYIARKESRPVLSAMINDNTGNSGDELEVRLNFKYINGNPSIYLMSNSLTPYAD